MHLNFFSAEWMLAWLAKSDANGKHKPQTWQRYFISPCLSPCFFKDSKLPNVLPHCLELRINLYLCTNLVCKLSSNCESKDSLHNEHFLTTGRFLGHLILYSFECTTLTFLLFFLFWWGDVWWGGDLCFSWASCGSGHSWASGWSWHHLFSLFLRRDSRGVKGVKWPSHLEMFHACLYRVEVGIFLLKW